MTAIPLNGRSYTDLLAIQPGVTPVSTLLPSSVIMAGVTGSIDPSGDAKPRQPLHQRPARILQRIHGQRNRRRGAHERRHLHPPQSRLHRRVPRPHHQLRSRVRQLQRRHHHRRQQIRYKPLPRQRLRVLPQHQPRRQRLLRPHPLRLQPEPVRRLPSAAPFGPISATRSSSSPTTREPAPRKASPPETSPSLLLDQRTGNFDDLTGSVSGPYLASLLTASNLAAPVDPNNPCR